MITATQLYNFTQCPHRVYADVFIDPALKDPPNAFVELLWSQGVTHEADIVRNLGVTADISVFPFADREKETRAAIARGEKLIYQGCLRSGDLIGMPDLLERKGQGYIPGDIKSGAGLEGDETDGKLKKHYAAQLAHYANILEQEGLGAGHETFIIDKSGSRVPYMLDEPQGKRNAETWWNAYQRAIAQVRALLNQKTQTLPALGASCKLCTWYTHCKREVMTRDDLTQIAELGRSKRDAMLHSIPTVAALASCDPQIFFQGTKTEFPGIGQNTLVKFHERAKLLTTPGATPYLKTSVQLPVAEKEVYFDIEADPMRDIVYLHGFVERLHGQPQTARFVPCFAEDADPVGEEAAFQAAWDYLSERIRDSVIYYYSSYEKTAYRKLAEKFPTVCSVDDVDDLFGQTQMVDLYTKIIKPCTEWPTFDQSIKTLAVYLGFHWRDTNPSGAASIEWYNQWIETGDPAIKQRILDYNEDDCLATGVVVDGIKEL